MVYIISICKAYVAKSYNNFLFEMPVQSDSDNTSFQIVYLDLVICLRATCSNILQANTVSSTYVPPSLVCNY